MNNRITKTDLETETNVLCLVKGDERYIFLFDDAHQADTLTMLGKFASDKRLSFTWYDAAKMSQRIREVYDETE